MSQQWWPDYTPKPIATKTTVDGRTVYLWRVIAILPFTRFSFPAAEDMFLPMLPLPDLVSAQSMVGP